MVDYKNGIIYKLVCKNTGVKDVYVGSTCNLKKRRQEHKGLCNNVNNKEYGRKVYKFIRANGGFQNWGMILVEKYPCKSKQELTLRERYWKDKLDATLNTNVPGRLKKEYAEQYREHNREKIKEYNKEYREQNREKIKEYLDKNREKIKEYREKNREKLLKRASEKIQCSCGSLVRRDRMTRHKKTAKHAKLIAAQ